jgi:osmotically-inducible protein OsmY
MLVNTDHEAIESIIDVLRRDSRVDPNEVNVRVEDSVVYVSGMVDSAAERQAVIEDIQSIWPERIIDTLTLANFIERTDEELTASVKQAMMRDIAVDAGPIGVEARDGVVVLVGTVASHAHKYNAEDVAWWTPGVTEVISHLEVDGVLDPTDEPDY